ncbi:MAG: hypothetical protein KAY24_02790, partial [Candidatus Eisenbacteria sp.]|nr:hypothetical protein [Candidatus Eisenbacteria bacterium]
GTHIDFARLPDQECKLMIYTLAGDLVQRLHHNGRAGNGTVRWNMITRNGQDITSGVYLYAVACDHETVAAPRPRRCGPRRKWEPILARALRARARITPVVII